MTSKRRKMNDTNNNNQLGVEATTSSQQQLNDDDTTTTRCVSPTSSGLQDNNSNNYENKIYKSDHSNQLLSKLNEMRTNEQFCDYEIVCNGKRFPVHKCVLIAQSDFFKAMLTGSMRESKENSVDLKGFKTTIGVESMLNYMYTGLLKVTFDNIVYLLDAASHLQINDVICLCVDYLIKNLDFKNCVNILKIADTFALKQVDLCTKEFITRNFVDVYTDGDDQFIQFTCEQLIDQLTSDYLQVSTELDLFLMCVKWIEADKTNRVKYAAQIMQHIRFMTMSPYELADYVETVDFMREIDECYKYLIHAYKYHSLPNRQPLVSSEQTKLRTKSTLVAVGETNIFVLNEVKQKWETICSAPLEENYPYPFAAITINNYLYVLGTRRSTSEEYKTCYRFSPRNLQWTPLAPLLHDRSRFGAAVVGNFIYIFGGFEGFKRSNRVYLNTVDRYSIENDYWEEYSHEGPQMSSMAACTLNNLIYFGGGKNMNWSKVSDFYCINVNNKQIEQKASMLTARTTHQITVFDERIIVIGGFDDAGNGILSIESYNIFKDQWTVITNIPGTLSKTWPQSVGVINGRIYISVFHTPNTFKIMQKGYFYDIYANVWSEASVVHERARYCPTCALTFPRKVYNADGDEVACVNHDQTIKNIEKKNIISQNIDDTIISTRTFSMNSSFVSLVNEQSPSTSSSSSIDSDNLVKDETIIDKATAAVSDIE